MIAKKQFAQKLLTWFSEHSRDLPWRKTYEPYHIWVSEIMLQQTQVDRVVNYFNAWVARFPDIKSLAVADEDEVLRFWEGLGYYSRARNLRKAAVEIFENGCRLPDTYDSLISLPGIGPYTAGAIMSIAYNKDYPLVDANVERVFSRLFDIATPVKTADNKKFIWKRAEDLLPAGKSRFFNQALMELGALVCLPKKPLCSQCPGNTYCKALKLDTVDKRPVRTPKKKTIHIEMATGIVKKEGKILIQKRLADDVWANLWEFPGGRLKKGEKPGEAIVREFHEETGLRIRVEKKITSVRHSYMHYRVILHGFYCEDLGKGGKEPEIKAAQENRWVTLEELHEFAFPAGHRKLIDYLIKNNS